MLTQKEKNQERQSRNRGYKTLIKRLVQEFKELVKGGAKEQELKNKFSEVQKVLDKASNKKIIKQNNAKRNKSRLHKLIPTNDGDSISEQ